MSFHLGANYSYSLYLLLPLYQTSNDIVFKQGPAYKRERPSHFRHNLISILIKSCSARGRSELFPKELQNKIIKPN